MSTYRQWDLYSLGHRYLEWCDRARNARTSQQRRSYEGELAKIEEAFNEVFFTGPYWPGEHRTKGAR